MQIMGKHSKGMGVMKTEEIFYILGTDVTKDEAVIKQAYREKLTVTNPEDNPEGFKRLRQAYEEACVYARRKEEPEEEQERDTTPSGLWLEEAVALYGRFSERCNPDKWQSLFNEDIYQSLDGEEECREKLLIFMLDHFKFPLSVWQVFDKNMHIVQDSTRLKEKFPGDFVEFIVRSCKEDNPMDYTLFSGSDDGDYDFFLQCYNDCWGAINEENYEQAEQFVEQAAATGISHPYMDATKSCIYLGKKQYDKAEALLRELIEAYPKDQTVLYQTANFYWTVDRKEEAIPYFLKLKELEENHYMANYRLAYWYAEQEKYEEAKECIRLVIRRGCDDEFFDLRMGVNEQLEKKYNKQWKEDGDIGAAIELAWCYLQDDRYFAASKIMQKIKDQVPDEKKLEYKGLLARIYISQAKHKDAIAMAQDWQDGLEKEMQNKDGQEREDDERSISIAYKIKMSAYHAMARGKACYFDDAIKEYESLAKLVDNDPNLLIEIARIYLEKGDNEKSLELAEELLHKYQAYYAYSLMVEAYANLWDAGGVVNSAKECIYHFPDYPRAYEEAARVYCDLNYPEELTELLEDAKKNGVESIYLDNWAYHGKEVPEDYPIQDKLDAFREEYYLKVEDTGNLKYYEEGFQVITEYLNMYPCHYILIERGRFSMAAKMPDVAMKDFQKVLERDPADQFALNNVGCLHKYAGRYEEALVYFTQAKEYMYREDKEEPNLFPIGNLGHTYELMGEYELAAETYQQMVDEFEETSLVTIKDLSANYARIGQLEKALEIIETYWDGGQIEKKQHLRYRAMLYAGKWKEARDTIKKYGAVITDYKDTDYKTERFIDYRHMWSWYHVLNGRLQDGIHSLSEAMLNIKVVSGAKERSDLISNMLFFLSLEQPAKDSGEKDANEIQQPQVVDKPVAEVELPRKKQSLCKKLSNIWKKSGEPETTVAMPEQTGTYEEERSKRYVKELEGLLNYICTSQIENGQPRDAIQTEYFFYKDRYVKYLEFMIALYGKGVEAGKKALEDMEGSLRCRLCNHSSCMRLTIAKALLAEAEGRKEEAYDLYKQLADEQPYNMYAQAKLTYEKN